MSKTDRLLSYIVGMVVMVAVAGAGYGLLDDYARAEDFPVYRLAFNFAEGKGLVYNTNEAALPTTSPLFATLIGLCMGFLRRSVNFTPDLMHYLATGMAALGYGLASSAVYRFLRRVNLSGIDSVLTLILCLVALPVWSGFRSPAPFTLLFILLALETGERGEWRTAGLIAGLAILAQPEGALGCLASGIYASGKNRGERFWQTVWLPGVAWAVVAALIYPDGYLSALILAGTISGGSTAQMLAWIGLLAIAALILYGDAQFKEHHLAMTGVRPYWILVLWAALEIGARMLVSGRLAQIESLPLALALAISIVIAIRSLIGPQQRFIAIGLSLATLFTMLVVWFPRTADELARDRELGRHLLIPAGSDLLTDRSAAIIAAMPDFNGNLYLLDGSHSPWVRSFIEREDYQSLIIAAAPRFIYFNADDGPLAGIDLRGETLQALGYGKELDLALDPGQQAGDELWIRRGELATFGVTHSTGVHFGPDVRLQSYATDRERLLPGETVRVRLDWKLTRPPKSELTVMLSLLDINGLPVVSVFPVFPAKNWQPLALSTYHALRIPETAETGLVNVQVALDYRAAIIGRNQIGSLVVAPPQPETLPATTIGQIDGMMLYEATVTPVEGSLKVEFQWGVQRVLDRDYQVLVHLIPVDNPVPVAFGDGPPLEGRYPTSYWRPGELIPDAHLIPLTNVPPGVYRIFAGFYMLETFERLRDAEKDSLVVAKLTLDAAGKITILPAAQINRLIGG